MFLKRIAVLLVCKPYFCWNEENEPWDILNMYHLFLKNINDAKTMHILQALYVNRNSHKGPFCQSILIKPDNNPPKK